MAILTNGNFSDIIAIAPDMRFGNTFLSTKFRDYSTAGEVMMDKVSGEIFFKRPEDGKIISFEQNKKYLHEVVWELKVLLNNNPNFSYPKNNEGAYFLSMNYDLIAINNEQLINIVAGEDVAINNTSASEVNKLSFCISKESNGFFCKLLSRDCDKPIIEYITNQYNALFENYTGSNVIGVAEAERFNELRWKDSNAIMKYSVVVTDTDGESSVFSSVENIRINEDVMVNLPTIAINEAFAGKEIASIRIEINSVEYHKLHIMFDNMEMIEEIGGEDFMRDFTNNLNKFLFKDSRIEIGVLNVMTFVDSANDIILHNNENILAMIDIPYTTRYMEKMATMTQKADILVSVEKPTEETWNINTIWAERIYDFKNGILHSTNSQTDLKLLEHYLSTYGTVETRFNTDSSVTTDMPVEGV